MRSRAVGNYPVSKRYNTAGPFDLLPSGHRAKGGNVAMQVSAGVAFLGTTNGSITCVADMWRDWTVAGPNNLGPTWTSWWKPNIDAVKSLGGNTVRVFATVMGRSGSGSSYASPVSDADYFARWDQLLSYLRSQGMYAYPCLCIDDNASGSDFGGFTASLSWRIAEAERLIALFAKYLDVVMAVDLVGEGAGWAGGGNGTTLYGSLRAFQLSRPWAGYIPMTISAFFKAAPNPNGSNSQGNHWPPIGSFDFLDGHCYYAAGPHDYDSTLVAYNVPVMIGEFGTTADSLTTRQNAYNQVKAIVNNSQTAPAPLTMTVGASGGTLTAGTYSLVATYVTATGETLASVVSTQAISGVQTLQAASPQQPAAALNVTGWNLYVTQANGAVYSKQNGSPLTTWNGTNQVISANPTTGGATPPVSDSSGLTSRRVVGASPWCIFDQQDTDAPYGPGGVASPSLQWGMFDGYGNDHGDVSSIYQSFPS